jgi:hypothetical protein
MKERQQPDYLRLAAADRLEAASGSLENVKRKHLLSAAAWEGLAHSASKVAEVRARRWIERSAKSLEISQ